MPEGGILILPSATMPTDGGLNENMLALLTQSRRTTYYAGEEI
jgi:hypothetical protein